MEMVPFSWCFIVVAEGKKQKEKGGKQMDRGPDAISPRTAGAGPAWQIRSRRLIVTGIEAMPAPAYTDSPSNDRATPAQGTTV
ncbi:hypothetical protein [Ralstonia pseudosolanacearum]|uniref:hypothetical protein n=1 Tax=Ralstonia pseudosolanacearum TaxID=1310165 RepID=UPI0026753467|nr:hypothetical protein [Ralstonia pseudosolanacearum]MDO3562138.1 hypothetical protein [Ralstonia pseudosolanacearum]MDO3573612.1 hypothetical protein [Ralstonia pseudosolanacearum]